MDRKEMQTSDTKRPDGSVTMTITYTPTGSLLEQEEQIAEVLNEAGKLATKVSL